MYPIFRILRIQGLILAHHHWLIIIHKRNFISFGVSFYAGNSITEGWVRTHPDFFKTNGYIGRGISGQTSYQFLLRFREDVINLSPALVVINAGTNDVAENTGAYNEDYTFGNIASMAELAKANKIKVILTSVLPAAEFPCIQQ